MKYQRLKVLNLGFQINLIISICLLLSFQIKAQENQLKSKYFNDYELCNSHNKNEINYALRSVLSEFQYNILQKNEESLILKMLVDRKSGNIKELVWCKYRKDMSSFEFTEKLGYYLTYYGKLFSCNNLPDENKDSEIKLVYLTLTVPIQ
jgi:hypothetical protein